MSTLQLTKENKIGVTAVIFLGLYQLIERSKFRWFESNKDSLQTFVLAVPILLWLKFYLDARKKGDKLEMLVMFLCLFLFASIGIYLTIERFA